MRYLHIMNYDHLLTRIFDKQEKKMLYSSAMVDFEGLVCQFLGVSNDRMYFGESKSLRTNGWQEAFQKVFTIQFGDRFIPMLCSGMKTRAKNKKLIYQGDILSGDPHGTVFVEFNQEYGLYECAWFDNDIDDDKLKKCTQLLGNALNDCGDKWEITDNIYQNEELYKKILEGNE